ncbi:MULTISPECIES: cardiolipin synthase [Prevotellaceae]|jgi:cardiolipin synthase|uniref:Cardiolipin synthase n=1 Tax=Xylanibacter rarus TaxID=1676614 RepID=A0A8E1R143_9BACT|nr:MULTISPECIES: cardiolipin synthase [Prevotellaceae]KOO68397.1 cardiolipin synthetase [Xylanibacter rarus]MBS5875233.1 cardiolipin synthase [Prevotella sp.]
MKICIFSVLLFFTCNVCAQTSDSLIVENLRDEGITFSHNNSVTLLMSGQEKFDDMFQAIRQARSSVHLEYFNFRNDSIASLLFRLLAQKAKEGVEVRALFDGFGNDSNNRPLKRKHLKQMRSVGIEIYEFDPVNFPWVNHVFHRDHRKIVVIDGKIAYTGGMNVADYYINGTEVVGEWRDMHCRIEGDEVNTLQKIFLRMWNKVTGQNVYGAKYYRGYHGADYITGLKPDTCCTAGKKMVGIINREPRVTNKIIRKFYTDAINEAKDSIKLVNPYLTLNNTLKRALRNAVKRGVKVEIMVSAHSDIPLTPDCVFYNVHNLMQHGVDVWIYKKGFHHTKIIMVDGRFCTVGSANLNARSLNFDYEENAVIIDPCTTKELNDMFERDKAESFKLTEETWDEWRTPWQKFVGWFASLLTPFL